MKKTDYKDTTYNKSTSKEGLTQDYGKSKKAKKPMKRSK